MIKNTTQIFKSDKAIEEEFENMEVIKIELNKSGISGYIELNFPCAGDSVGGGTSYVVDHWIKYPHNNVIAFNNWYPEKIYFKLVDEINTFLNKNRSINHEV